MLAGLLVSPAAPSSLPSVPAEPSFLAEKIYFPFYDYLVAHYFPKSWTPNKVTLFGVAMTLLASCLLLASMPLDAAFVPPRAEMLPSSLVVEDQESVRYSLLYPSRIQPVFPKLFTPGSLLTLCGLLNLIYCVADNTDGRLARRDRKTSVIGEYLDHGLDCVTSLLSVALVFAVMGGSLSNMSISLVLIAFVTLLSHTLNYERSVFIWGNRIASVDEAMIFFGVCMWIPQIFPHVGDRFTAEVPWLLKAGNALHVGSIFPSYQKIKGVEIIYVFYCLTQAQTIFSILCRNWRMLFRLQTLFMIANGAILLALIPAHSAHVAAFKDAHGAHAQAPGYALGCFTYPAVWIILAASTCSIIVHIAIAARCCHLQRPNYLPLGGLFVVWLMYLTCPAGAAALAVTLHVVQVLVNLSYIEFSMPRTR